MSDNAPIEGFIQELQGVYKKYPDEFAEECSIYTELLPRLVAKLGATYNLVRPFALGSTATVWEVEDKVLQTRRALKLTRPRLGKLRDIISVIRSEPKQLATLNHDNIIKVYGSGEVDLDIEGEPYSLPYFLMEYFEKVADANEYIVEILDQPSAGTRIIEILRDFLDGLAFLHEHNIVHCDIKPGNLLVANDRGLVADLGYSKHLKRLKEEPAKLTEIRYTPRYAHPALQQRMIESSDSNANRAEIRRDQVKEAFDLFAFGRSMQQILREIRSAELSRPGGASVFTPYQWRYLSYISKRLLDGIVTSDAESDVADDLATSVIPGLSEEVMQEIKYESADEALESLEKLLHLYDLEGFIPELNPNLTSYIQIPDGRVPMTPRVKAIINHPSFDHLMQTTQLGFVSLVYPGATHTRFEHVLGTFVRCCDYVRALWYDEYNCLFQMIMSKRDLEALLLAALLHDIGQYPMAHDLTEASKKFRHEELGEQALYLRSPQGDTVAHLIQTDWDVDHPATVLSILSGGGANASFRERILHSVISGPLDCDKLDYLIRDSTHLGLKFGSGIDRERLLRNVTIAYKTESTMIRNAEGHEVPQGRLVVAEVGVRERALIAAQSLWQARKDMFTTVYWQHTVRSLKAMLAYVVRGILLRLEDSESAQEEFWYEFHQFIFAPNATILTHKDDGAMTSDGGGTAELDDDGIFWPASKLSPSDDALICFLFKFANAQERRILRAIRERAPFRRVRVVSYAHEQDLYESVYGRFKTYYEDDSIALIEGLRRAWESEIVSRVSERLESIGHSDAAERLSGTDPVVLVDVPVRSHSRSRTSELLWFLPEGQGTSVGTPRFEDSKVEVEQVGFDKHVGKIRILAHPEWRDVILRNVQQDEWKAILENPQATTASR